jgi:hypothetical protein
MHLYFNLESLKRNNKGIKREVDGRKIYISKESIAPTSIVGDCTLLEEEYGPS